MSSRHGAGILRRAEAFSSSVESLLRGRTNPLSVVITDNLGPVEAIINGVRTLMFGTNSYLGLNFHQRAVQAAAEAVQRFGTGSTASRVASGNHRLHVGLETKIAALYGCKYAVIYSTGFMANLAVISGLVREGDALFVDAHCHASILAAARLSGAQVRLFRHNDAGDLDRLLQASEILGSKTLVVVEGLYSVLGDLAELRDIVAVVKRHNAVLVVDEAHSFGIYGENGRGVCEHLGVEESVDVIVGTFSKSVGVIGGYSVTDRSALRSLRFAAQPYLYTASLPPAIVAAASEAVSLIGSEPQLRQQLWQNAHAMYKGLTELGLVPGAPAGPVGCIAMSSPASGYEFWEGLLARGIYVNLLIPPATPSGEAVLRYSLSAAHTTAHIGRAIQAFREVIATR